jgi:hypothetical protein
VLKAIVKIMGIYIYAVITVIVTITGRFICSVNGYCDNNGEIYM